MKKAVIAVIIAVMIVAVLIVGFIVSIPLVNDFTAKKVEDSLPPMCKTIKPSPFRNIAIRGNAPHLFGKWTEKEGMFKGFHLFATPITLGGVG